MKAYLEITDIHGQEIMDSRGNPTVEVEVTVKDHVTRRVFWAGRPFRRELQPDSLKQ